jgi:hypothetical protein
MDCSDRNRRSMTEALRTGDVTEEALAFVTGKVPRQGADQAPVVHPQGSASSSPVQMPSQPSAAAPIPNAVSENSATPLAGPGTVSITVRLPESLPPRLLRASVERKLRRETPFTQQDIVAEALDHWLRQHGHFY